ncbi:MAG: ATPase [Bacteroidetes bacterium]|nr:MAG: ATPase [Bacteroidota bacterium]
MPADRPTLLCLASYFKGERFLEAAHRAGARVVLLTREKLADEPWPMDHVDERFLLPDLRRQPDVTHAVSYLARTRRFDRIVALDEYDTPTAASLRAHLGLPGPDESTARRFRDKLTMRLAAREAGLTQPAFVPVLNHDDLRAFMEATPPPWVLKPRAEASAMGIRKLTHPDALWPLPDELGDRQSYYVLERFLPGDVFHVDAVVWDGQVLFAAAQQYGEPPLDVYQGGGVFLSRTVPHDTPEEAELLRFNRDLVAAFGLRHGVTHAEFIRHEGRFYFLEVAARVGGAGIDRLVEAATGLNPWEAWAHVEVARARGDAYRLPPLRRDYAGLVVCLSRQPWPDLSVYDDPEVVWRLHKKHHAGLVVAAPEHARVEELLHAYAPRFAQDFLAWQPPLDTAPE